MRISLLILYQTARHRAAREDGVIALLTLVFMMVLGLVIIATLWSIGYATGAYNELYSNSQAAAYASVGRTVTNNSGSSQLDFDCSNRTSNLDFTCSSGSTFAVTQQVLSRAFRGQFGLTYSSDNTGSVRLTDENYNAANLIYAYYIPRSAKSAEQTVQDNGGSCPYILRSGPDNATATELMCWQVATGGLNTPHYESGVVVHAVAAVKLPGCNLAICATDLQVTTAATISQAAPTGS
jgi:hypothetical protein